MLVIFPNPKSLIPHNSRLFDVRMKRSHDGTHLKTRREARKQSVRNFPLCVAGTASTKDILFISATQCWCTGCPWLVLMSWVTTFSGMYVEWTSQRSLFIVSEPGSWLRDLRPICPSGFIFETWGHWAELPHKAGLKNMSQTQNGGTGDSSMRTDKAVRMWVDTRCFTCFQLQAK